MTKVYPNVSSTATAIAAASNNLKPFLAPDGKSEVLTVWKKSLLFNCHGFTVFDSTGNLVYRVDNYCAGTKGEVILMDASGNSLLTVRRKRLSLSDNWLVYDGETAVNPILTARKHANFLQSKSLVQVSSGCSSRSRLSSSPTNRDVLYVIEGSYAQRCCAIYDKNRQLVAEIKRKEAVGGAAFGADVFRLVVQPEIDSAVAMALVILLDEMFGSSHLDWLLVLKNEKRKMKGREREIGVS